MIKDIFKFVGSLISGILNLLFLLLVNGCLIALGSTILVNENINTVHLTNLGFAMFVGIATTIFSWSRAVERENSTQSQMLNRLAIKSFMCAFLFAIGSLFKYTMMQQMDFGPFQFLNQPIPMKVIMSLVFFIVIFQVNVILTELYFIWISEKVMFEIAVKRHGLLMYIDYAKSNKQRIIGMLEDHRISSKDTIKELSSELDEQEHQLSNLEKADPEERKTFENTILETRLLLLSREKDIDQYFDDMTNWVSQNPIKAFLFPSLLARIKLKKTELK